MSVKKWKYGILNDAVVKASSNISLNKIKEDIGDYPVYGAKGLVQHVSFYQQEEEYLGIIKDGAGIGRVTKHPPKSSILATMQYIIPKKDFDIDFVKYFLLGIDFENYRTGSTIPHIYYKDYKNATFPLVGIIEQQQIVATLDSAFAAIDRAKANIEQNIENAKELFQSKLNDIFSQKGEGWEEKSIEEVSTVVNGFSFKSGDFSPGNKVKSIKITNVGIMEFVEDSSNNLPSNFLHEYSKVKVKAGNLVLALTRTIIAGGLKVARVPKSYDNALLNQRVAAIIPDKEIVDSDYLYYYFSSNIVYNYVLDNVNTLMQPNLSIGDLKRMNIPVTSLEGQKVISYQIGNLSKKSNSLISHYENKLNDLEELKKSILEKAFSGELKVGGLQLSESG